MTSICFKNPDTSVDVDNGITVLQAARTAGAPVGSTCGGACACSGCHVHIEDGAELLSEMEDDEETILSTVFGTEANSRLACQAFVIGKGAVTVRPSVETREAFEQNHARAG